MRLIEQVIRLRPGIELILYSNGCDLDPQQAQRAVLILLDLNLQDKSGRELLQQLKADPRSWDKPVVMISAEASSKQIATLLAGGEAA